MLRSVIGTITSHGLRTLRLEDERAVQAPLKPGSRSVLIWAVLESADLSDVCQAVSAMQPSAALRLLNERAISLGRITA